jgi:hypothetical protein
VSKYVVTFPPPLAITTNVLLSLERWIANDVSLFELSLQERSISLEETPTAVKPVGAAGVDLGVGVGVSLGVGVGVSAGVGVGVGRAVGVGVGVGIGSVLALAVLEKFEWPNELLATTR